MSFGISFMLLGGEMKEIGNNSRTIPGKFHWNALHLEMITLAGISFSPDNLLMLNSFFSRPKLVPSASIYWTFISHALTINKQRNLLMKSYIGSVSLMEIKEIWFIKKWVITFYNLWSCVTKWSTNSFGLHKGLFQKKINNYHLWVVPNDVCIQIGRERKRPFVFIQIVS